MRSLLAEAWHCKPWEVSWAAEEYPDEIGLQLELWAIEAKHEKPDSPPPKPGEQDFSTAEY